MASCLDEFFAPDSKLIVVFEQVLWREFPDKCPISAIFCVPGKDFFEFFSAKITDN